MKYRQFFLHIKIVILLLLLIDSHAQTKTDSLIGIFKNTNKKEKQIEILKKIVDETESLSSDSIIILIKKGIHLCQEPEQTKDKAFFTKTLAEAFEESDSIFKAIEQYQNYIGLSRKLDNTKEAALGFNCIGNIYIRIADYAKSLDNHLRSLNLREKIKDNEGIASSLNNIGIIYLRQDNYEQALNYFSRSLDIEKENENERGLASCYLNIGAVYEKKLSFDTALNYYLNSIKLNEKFDNMKDIASTYSNIAFIYDSKGNSDTALSYYIKSLELNKKIGDRQGVASTYLNIGIFYSTMWEWKKAIEYFENALTIGKEIHSLDIVMRSANELSNAYAKLSDFEKAYENHVLFKKAENKINNEESVKKFTQLEMQHEFDKKQKEQEYQRKMEIRRQRFINAFFIFGITFMIILAFVIYRNNRIKHRANILLSQQKAEIQTQRDEITDSIHYASRIQNALLPPLELREKILPEHFILNKPRDIVSGDYFWMTQKGNKTIVVAADCTGHGVPGAFMSMLGIAFLNEIVNKPEIEKANDILRELREYIIKSLHQTGKEGEQKDGMDMALVSFNRKTKKVEYSGAYNPLYHISNGTLNEIKADRMPIGIFMTHEPFTNQVIEVKPGDTLYIFSDGFVDQFGGEAGKKFKAKPFKELLLSIQEKNMKEQKQILDDAIENWRNGYNQIDDILVIGIRV